MAENIAEEIDKDTLVSLLKDKGKEIKTLEGKNKKLEERYVKIFKENKNLKQDRESLEKLLLNIFDRDQEKFTNIESGAYDAAALTELWNQRQDERLKLFNETLESHKNERSDLLKKITSLEDQIEKSKTQANSEIDKMVESYKVRGSDLEKANKKLNQEIKELNDIIEEKNNEIGRLRKAEDEVDSLKAELLMRELQMKNVNEDLNIKTKMQENDRKNEVLRLRHEVESLSEKIKHLENEKEQTRLNKLANMRDQSSETDLTAESIHEILNRSVEPSPRNASQDDLPRPIMRRASSGRDIPNLDENSQEYLKNVVVKLFCYIEGNNVKEAKALMNALTIMLKMTPQDRERIEDAKKGNTIWGNTVHFLKDTFVSKGDVNYYTNNSDSK